MMEYNSNRKSMVDKHIKARGLNNERIVNAFLAVPREKFVPWKHVDQAYLDGALPIGYGQTISQPYVIALMLELLDVNKMDYVCEIGAGSGYASAVLSKLCRKVVGFEIIPELANFAKINLSTAMIENVDIVATDATCDYILDRGPYDKILVSAATSKLPSFWVDALVEGGVIVLPEAVNNYIQVLVKYQKINGELKFISRSIPVIFVPLVGQGA